MIFDKNGSMMKIGITVKNKAQKKLHNSNTEMKKQWNKNENDKMKLYCYKHIHHLRHRL
jgi:hypothetical protein